ncbi:MAG: C25 family cysteine peptidase [Candidatus Zixiibacteriota bacterium]
MGKKLLITTVLFFCLVIGASAERIEFGTNEINVTVLESNDYRTVIEYQIGSFDKEPIEIKGETFYKISLLGESNSLIKGDPSLPKINRSIIIPDDAAMEAKILASEYIDFKNIPVAPSKGSISRNINPEDVPYEFGQVYELSDWFPLEPVSLSEPFIFRDYRGIVVELNPIQYNPTDKSLRVYKSITVEIDNIGPGKINVFNRAKSEIRLVSDFKLMYRDHFINYFDMDNKYPAVDEVGDLLIITYDSFHEAMMPLVDWKLQKGIKTTIVDVSTIGNTDSQIKAYINSVYSMSNLAYVLLVGDGEQIDVPYSNGDSDPTYGKLTGSDNWPEILVGRFSAENVTQVQTQVLRSINYEKTPYGTDWYQKATGIASDQGPGDDNEYDNEHENNIRDLLLAYGFTHVDQIYDPSANAAMVTTAVNNGRSIINYTGHGSTNAWSSSGFSSTNVNALTNDWMLPAIFSVACVNGDFVGQSCFAEAWLRATNGGNPTGAIATYMSTINQDWDEPMEGQDAFNDILVAEEKTTIGGLFVNAGCRMLETYPSAGVDDFDTWTVFGDPSVQIRIKNPETMTVDHAAAHIFTLPTLDVEVTGVEGALCAVYHNGILYGSAYTDAGGLASISFTSSLPIGEAVTLTVTAFNKIPYIAQIQVIAPNGPFVVLDEIGINDSYGNNDGLVNYGETILLDMQLQNVGPDAAYSVTATISTTDTFVTITDDVEIFGEIPGEFGILNINDAFAFNVGGSIPDGHLIEFEVAIQGSDTRDTTWISAFDITVYSPLLSYITMQVDDAAGNNNGILDPGETGDITIVINNSGSADAISVAGIITEDDDYVTILDDQGYFGDVYSGGGSANNGADLFTVSADASASMGHLANMQLLLSGSGGYSAVVDFNLVIGDRVAFFFDDFSFDQGWTGMSSTGGEWTIGPAVGGTGSDGSGGPDPSIDHSSGDDNYVLGNDLNGGTGGDYNSGLSTTYWVSSPLFDLSGFASVQMRYWHWLGVESPSYDHAYFQVYDGTGWVTLYTNTETVNETSWTEEFYDLSEYADGNQDFQIRFGIGSTDGSGQYCGWNIDDIELKGYGEIPNGSPEITTTPDALDDSLFLGDTVVDTVKIFNNGEVLLRARFSSNDAWIDFDTDQFNIAEGDSLMLPVAMNSSGLTPGDYYGTLQYFSNDPLNSNGSMPVHMHIYSPDIQISETEITETLEADQSSNHELYISNNGPGRLDYNIIRLMFNGKRDITVAKEAIATPLGYRPADPDKSDENIMEPYFAPITRAHGGPDIWGYNWVDSDDPDGPTYEWIDISGVGTAIEGFGDDDTTSAIPIGFSFPYYENSYSELYIGSNGIVTFDMPSRSRSNIAIPNDTLPNNLVSIWWDDLDPRKGGMVYYYSDMANDRFIVSFDAIPNYYSTTGTGSLSFQAVLYANGKIQFNYGVMDPGVDYDSLSGATIGIENYDGTDGLEVVYNADYIHDNMSILLAAANWLSVNPGGGSVDPFSIDTILVGFNAAEMVEGTYNGQLTINSNDPDSPTIDLPLTLNVSSEPQAPQPPALVYPENAAVDVVQPIVFDWSDINNADMYQMQIDTSSEFSTAKMDSSMAESFCDVSGLVQGMTYCWRVRGQNAVGWGNWSEVRTFTTEITWLCGDFDNNGAVNIIDITGIIGFLYKDGQAPVFSDAADVNGDGVINILDITTIITYLYKNGPDLTCQ